MSGDSIIQKRVDDFYKQNGNCCGDFIDTYDWGEKK